MPLTSSQALALQAFRILIYGSPLSARSFDIRAQRSWTQPAYEAHAWVGPGTHALHVAVNGHCAIELLTPRQKVPTDGLLDVRCCVGEHDREISLGRRIRYIGSVQTEVVTPSVYRAVLAEMMQHAERIGATAHRWRRRQGSEDCLSVLDVQPFRREFHAQAWHLDATWGIIVRSQVIFEIAAPKSG